MYIYTCVYIYIYIYIYYTCVPYLQDGAARPFWWLSENEMKGNTDKFHPRR